MFERKSEKVKERDDWVRWRSCGKNDELKRKSYWGREEQQWINGRCRRDYEKENGRNFKREWKETEK